MTETSSVSPSPAPVDRRMAILQRLAAIEAEPWNGAGVRILYASESGSRAWGFASRDSDWDVRFLYVHPPTWYLSVADRQDVIELPIADDLDINGWELRKALRLLRKGNPVLREWLHSPIVYRAAPGVAERLRRLAGTQASPRAALHHYLHMAQRNHREYLQGPEVRLKKYLYVLRPLLACLWIECGRGQPPVELAQLVDALLPTGAVRTAVLDLVRRSGITGSVGRPNTLSCVRYARPAP